MLNWEIRDCIESQYCDQYQPQKANADSFLYADTNLLNS